jgi:catecholate siderophore receptor
MNSRYSLRFLFLLGLSAILTFQVLAQAPNDKTILKGKVLDPNRASIEGADVWISKAGLPSSTAVTDRNGEFSLALAPGEYQVRIAAEGFSESTDTVNLQSNSKPLEVVLAVGPSSAIVTITDMAAYGVNSINTATKTLTPLRDIPQSISVVTKEQIRDQSMSSVADVIAYVPGITSHQGENNRDQLVIRGNSTSADFFLNGVRDDVQYYRDFYNVERVEALKGPNSMLFGRGGGGGVVNRVTKEAGFTPLREVTLQGGSFGNKRFSMDFDQPLGNTVALRLNGRTENSGSFRNNVDL